MLCTHKMGGPSCLGGTEPPRAQCPGQRPHPGATGPGLAGQRPLFGLQTLHHTQCILLPPSTPSSFPTCYQRQGRVSGQLCSGASLPPRAFPPGPVKLFAGLHGGDAPKNKRRSLLMLIFVKLTNLDSILKSRDITLSTKVHLVKAVFFPVVLYGCES